MPYHKTRKVFGRPRAAGAMTGSMRGGTIEAACVICKKIRMALGSYSGLVAGMQKIGGPAWDPLYCCNNHSKLEIEVWRVKTKRRV